MQQHPIPQNVTSYQFRLIGDMTIKQFLELSGGVALGVFFYLTNLFSPIKWTFIITSVLGGVALAFLPVQERPLDEWLIIFIKAIYKPTQYIWFKVPQLPGYFNFQPHAQTLPQDAEELQQLIYQKKKQGIQSFLQTLPNQQVLTELEQTEQGQVSRISQLFDLDSSNYKTSIITSSSLGVDTDYTPPPSVASVQESESEEQTDKIKPTNRIPAQQSVKIEQQGQTVYDASQIQSQSTGNQPTPQEHIAVEHQASTSSAQTDASLPFPSKPTSPNTIVGMVLTPGGKIIDNAIIEIRDNQGQPVRATKTNQLGQFFSTTPLPNGEYEIEIEKEGFSFDILKLELVGNIIEPLKIQSKARLQN